ncbi:MAG: fumarylacetoacetate hydrolase family protein [Armatimonadota bacterium]
MKLVRFTSAKYPEGTYGIFAEDSRIEVISGGLFDPIKKTGDVVCESEITRYLHPIDPPNVIAIGLNYVEHTKETQQKMPTQPLMFLKATTTVVGHGDNIVLPKIVPTGVDYEAELCAIIGRKAKNVSENEALSHVFGYCCGNDVSGRDVQFADGQWARGKSFDTFAPLGPYVITDFDPNGKRVISRLNGEVMQDGNTSDMVFSVATLVSFLSRNLTLLPGTVIMTGTPFGVGYTRTPPVALKPGDVSEVEVEGLGVLRNTVVAE